MAGTEITWCEALVGSAEARSLSSLDDAVLIESFLRTGEDDAFSLLVQRYQDRVFALVVSTLGRSNENEAEDLVQEIFITVYRKLGSFRGDCSFSTWLYRIARNRAIDFTRRPRRLTPWSGDQPIAAAEGARYADPRRLPEDEAGRTSAVLRHVDRLKEPRRTVVFLHYWMGCTIEEISRITEIREATVRSHLFRARRELGKRLRPEAAHD